MDPLEVGQKTLAGIIANAGLILTHPDLGEDIDEIYRVTMAAPPNEPIPEGRGEIERMSRAGNRAADEGMKIGLQ